MALAFECCPPSVPERRPVMPRVNSWRALTAILPPTRCRRLNRPQAAVSRPAFSAGCFFPSSVDRSVQVFLLARSPTSRPVPCAPHGHSICVYLDPSLSQPHKLHRPRDKSPARRHTVPTPTPPFLLNSDPTLALLTAPRRPGTLTHHCPPIALPGRSYRQTDRSLII